VRRVAATSCRPAARFTPTHVGKASATPTATAPAAVHPHARGEGFSVRRVARTHAGSPPRTWGRPRPARDPHGGGRFTPTHVGKAPPSPSACSPVAVHPHARGEGSPPAADVIGEVGSPPRTWGRPDLDRRPRHAG